MSNQHVKAMQTPGKWHTNYGDYNMKQICFAANKTQNLLRRRNQPEKHPTEVYNSCWPLDLIA